MKKLMSGLLFAAAIIFGAVPVLAYSLSPEGVLTVTEGDDPMLDLNRSSVTSIEVAEGVTALGRELLAGCTMAEEIRLPLSLTLIGERALADCASLTYVRLPSAVASVGNGAFSGCSFLKSVIVPRATVDIADDAFSGAVKVYGYSDSYASVYANRRVYRLLEDGSEDVIKERFTFESVDGCDTDTISVYRSGTPRVNYFRNNTAYSPITDDVGWLSQPDVYGIITVLRNGEFFWTDREGVRFESYFDARDAHRSNQYGFTPDSLNIGGEIAGVSYDTVSSFRGGLAVVGRGGKYGVADTEGNLTVGLTYPNAEVIGGEVFLTTAGGQYFTRTLNTLPPGTWLDADYCFGGRYMLRSSSGFFGYADRDLNPVIPLKYNRIPWGADYPFRDNTEAACLAIGDKLILVDKNGNELLYFN